MKHRWTTAPLFVCAVLIASCASSPSDTPDAAPDAEDDVALDTPNDVTTDVTADLIDANADTAVDAPVDVAIDAPADVAIDPPRDVVADAPADVARDVVSDAPLTWITPGDPGAADVRMTVRGELPRHAISRYVYGWNSPDWVRARGVTFIRSGGNRMTAWNWENNASNAGNDYQYQNDNYLCSSAGCDRVGEVARRFLDGAVTHDTSAVLTLPMAGYVAADILGGGDVRRSGAGYLTTRFRRSVSRKGSAFTLTPSLADEAVYQDEFVNWVNATYPVTSRGTREIFYELDNEPDLWASTHAEIHPDRATYSELITHSTELASAVKAVSPSTLVFGPVSYGWAGFVNLQDAPDAMGRDFIETWLDGMRAASDRAGRRLVDVLDLHWYPEAQGAGVRITQDGASDAVADARVQAPRSLWDSAYTETSWITMWSTMGPIALIPRMRAKIEAHYPGTRLALTEYYFGGGADISGGIAQADALGVFGRESVYAAANWHMGMTDDRFIYGGLAMFRNYDGAGAAFGDTSLPATVSDDSRAAVYASVDSTASTRMVLVLINRARSVTTAALAITDSRRYSRGETYTLTADLATPRRGPDYAAVATNAFRVAMPARSVTTLVLHP